MPAKLPSIGVFKMNFLVNVIYNCTVLRIMADYFQLKKLQ